MAQTSSTVNDLIWNGLGAAAIGGITGALVAFRVVKVTIKADRRHAREQEARAVVRELVHASHDFLNSIGHNDTYSPEDRQARRSAYSFWAADAEIAQASLQAIDARIAQRVALGARHADKALGEAEALGDSPDRFEMSSAVERLAQTVRLLNDDLVHWIATGKYRVTDPFPGWTAGDPAPGPAPE